MDSKIEHKYQLGSEVKASDSYTRFGPGSGEIRVVNHLGHITRIGPRGKVCGILFRGELEGVNHILLSYTEGAPPNPFDVPDGIYYWIDSGDTWIREAELSHYG